MIACVRVLNFALRLHLLEYPERDGEPLVLSPAQGERRQVLDCTPEARALYIRPGMAIRDVVAMTPNAVVVESNPAREAAEIQRILTELEGLSPLVEADGNEPGCWYVDLAGLERLLGTPQVIARQLLELMPPLLRPRVGIAAGKFSSRVAAGRAAPGSFEIVKAEETRSFLARERIEVLSTTPERLRLLRELGIETLGQLTALAPTAIAARFGPEGRALWELASGNDSQRVKPRSHEERIVERMELPSPTASRETLLFALRLLVEKASMQPQLRGRGARSVLVRAIYEDGGSWEKRVAMRGTAQGERLAELLRLRFQALELLQPVVELELQLSNLGPETARQAHFADFFGRDDRPIREAHQQLKGRYNASALYHIVPVEPWSRIPERRYALMPIEPMPSDEPKVLNPPRPIDVETSRVSQGKPEPQAVVHGGRRKGVERIEDFWYLAEEWWLRPIRRRYFQVMLEGGTAQTIFHNLGDRRWYEQAPSNDCL